MITGRKEEDEAARSRAGTKISLFIALFGSCVVLFSIRKSDAQINSLILKVYHSNGLDGLKDIYLDPNNKALNKDSVQGNLPTGLT